MSNKNTAVALFVYNRPIHTKQVIDALSKNEEAKDSLLYIYCDGAKENVSSDELQKITETRSLAKAQTRFKEITIIESEKNKGLANSIIDGVTEVINKHGKVIVLEDDVVPAPGFLRYMNDALALYETEEKVGCVHAWNYVLDKTNYPEETFFLRGADCWGWATWQRAWKLFEPDGKKLLQQIQQKKLEYSFDRNGTHQFTAMLQHQIEGKNNSWAIRWHASLFLADKYCLQPTEAIVKNIGLDGTGTHSSISALDQKAVDTIQVKKIPVKESDWFFSAYAKTLKKENAAGNGLKDQIKGVVKAITPPVLINLLRKKNAVVAQAEVPAIWSGDYANWQDAQAKCTGYDTDLILEKCKAALLKVKNGEAVYERDSVLFDEIEYSWPLLAGLQKAALENDGKLCVLDFGGSLGSTYYQNKSFLNGIKNLEWCIVEQPHFVDCGKLNFENNQLKFYHTIEECLEKHKPNVLLLSSVINYLEAPYHWLTKFKSLMINYIIFDRTAFINKPWDIITVQNVPEEIYKANYPCWFFNIDKVKNFLADKYELIVDNIDYLNSRAVINNSKATWRILIFKSH